MATELKDLTIREISLVDKPACPGARVALYKRDESVAKAVKYLVTESDGTTHLPYTGPDGKPDHRLMGAAWAALHGGYRGNKYEGPNKQAAIARLKHVYEQESMDTPADKTEKGASMTPEEIEKKLGDLETETVALKAANLALTQENDTILKMSKKEKKAYAKWDATKRKAYMAADAAKRKEMMDAECDEPDEDDEAKKIAKSAAAEKAALEARLAKSEGETAAIKKQLRLVEFTKRAEDLFPHTAGKPEDKGARLLNMADTFGEESVEYKSYLADMQAADKAIADTFRELGKSGAAAVPGEAALEAAAEEIAKRNNLTREMAYLRACEEYPELYKRAQDEIHQRQRGLM